MFKLRPVPTGHGVGFYSMERMPQYADRYNEQNVGRYWNYLVTPNCYEWPEPIRPRKKTVVIDGFSPNLNKKLHVGHLRNLALAKALSVMPDTKMVAMLGASLGVTDTALAELNAWFDFIDYHPVLYYDNQLTADVPRRKDDDPESKTYGCELWAGPKKGVIVTRSNGTHTYKYHDLAFLAEVNPDYYVTGAEQTEHFQELGLKDRHLPYGLILGSDGKKMKSRTGDAPLAEEILDEIQANLKPTPEPKKLAWNILAWNLLSTSRPHTIKYDPERWTDSEHPGMTVTYTYARMRSALANKPAKGDLNITQDDANLLGFADYYKNYVNRSIELMDPVELAHFAKDLAGVLNSSYHRERIDGGRQGHYFVVRRATDTLGQTMKCLGMFPLEKV